MTSSASVWNEFYLSRMRSRKKDSVVIDNIPASAKNILELFVSSGENYSLLSRNDLKKRCIGVDINETLCREAKKKGFLTVVADCRALPFRKETFDLIFCNSFHHIANDFEDTFCQTINLLKPCGTMIGIEPHGIISFMFYLFSHIFPNRLLFLLPKQIRIFVEIIKYEIRTNRSLSWFGKKIMPILRKAGRFHYKHDLIRLYYTILKETL